MMSLAPAGLFFLPIDLCFESGMLIGFWFTSPALLVSYIYPLPLSFIMCQRCLHTLF